MALEAGTVVTSDGEFRVNLGGVLIDCRWDAGFTPVAGDTVYIDRAQDRALASPFTTTARPEAGTVSSGPSDGTIGVLGDDGVTYRSRYSDPAPTSGTRVYLIWQSPSRPYATAGELAPVPDELDVSAPPPPPTASSGRLHVAAWGSGTGRPYGWQGGQVVQGRYGSAPENRGIWFHGNGAGQLAGATTTRVQIWLGARLNNIGNYNAAATFSFYLSTSNSPAADFSRVAGPHNVSIPARWGGGWVDLPAGWGSALAATGGGIALGDSAATVNYAGAVGIDRDPQSGLLAIDWTR